MEFNPDEYIKEDAPFDPDAFIAENDLSIISEPAEEVGFFEGLAESFTGESRMTPAMESMPEIGEAPELNSLSIPAFKSSFGMMLASSPVDAMGVLNRQFGDSVNFAKDEKGNVVARLPSGLYALNKPGFSATDALNVGFDMAAFTPAGRAATLGGAFLKNAATEAALGAAEQGLGGGEISGKDIVEAGAFSSAGKILENSLGAGWRWLKGSPTDDAAELLHAGAQSDVPVLTSDVYPPKTFPARMASQMGEKIPVAGTGGKREAQQVKREQAIDELASKYNTFSYTDVVDSLKTKTDRIKNAAGAAIQRTVEELDDLGAIPIDSTLDKIQEVHDLLNRSGVIKSEGAIKDLNKLMEVVLTTPQTFSSLKENRTLFREIVNGADQANRSQLTSRAKSLLKQVESSMTDDMTAMARENLTPEKFRKWRKANAVYKEHADDMTKTAIKNILDKGEFTPEVIESMVFSKKPSEVKKLYSSLTVDGRKNVRSAIVDKIVTTLSRRAGGVTPNTFASEANKYGLQIDTFFKGQEKRELNGFLKLMDRTRRAQDAGVVTATGQQALGAGTLGALYADFQGTIGLGALAGGISHIYESKAVRDALIRINSLPKGSTAQEQAMAEAAKIIQPMLQAYRRETEEQNTGEK